tara:strand:+ start:17826 stop:19604 length:1779 start_codon:yes stop_codon:yes gene_type:complete
MKNYIISDNEKLEIKGLKKITTDVHLYNYFKFKKNKKNIEFLKLKTRSNLKEYKAEYKIIKSKSLNYSKALRIFLNDYHKTSFSNFFWDKVLNEQLYRLTLIIFDFYSEFKYISKKNYLSNITSEKKFNPPELFSHIFKNLEFNNEYRDEILRIFLLNFNNKKIYKTINLDDHYINRNNFKIKPLKNENFFLKIFNNFNLLPLYIENKIRKIFFNKKIHTAIIKSYFQTKFRLILENKSKLKISTINFPSILKKKEINYECRKNLSNSILVKDDFDFFFKKIIISFFPKILLEDFQINKLKICEFYNHNKELKYVINESFLSDDWSNLNLALGKELFNVKHIYNEHNYLTYILFGNRVKEFSENVDLYFSIGWENKNFSLVQKGANLSIKKSEKIKNKRFDLLFLPSFSFSRKPYFANYISKETGFNYYKSSLKFLKGLNRKIKNNLYIKLHPNSFNYMGFDYYYHHIKQYNLIDKKYSSQKVMRESKMIILDHYSTTFLEVIKLNLPFILIMDKKYTYQSNLKYKDFEELIKNNIVHLSEKKASRFLNKIYGKHLEWWKSKKVSTAIKNFTDKHIGNEEKFISKLIKLANN